MILRFTFIYDIILWKTLYFKRRIDPRWVWNAELYTTTLKGRQFCCILYLILF